MGALGFSLFSFVVLFSLFDSQFATIDGLSRATTDALWQEHGSWSRKRPYRFWYLIFVVIICIAMLAAIPVGTPYAIWLMVAWISKLHMPMYMFALIYVNNKCLPKKIKPRWYDNLILILAGIELFVFFIMLTWDIFRPK